jgi:pimeloyl-ACP methyl ester carboxylesterase
MNRSYSFSLPEVTAPSLPEEPWADSLLTALGRVLDATVLQAMRAVVDATLMPRPQDLSSLRGSASPFVDGELWSDPRRFFAFIDEPVAPVEVRGRERRRFSGGIVIGRELVTAYRPHPSVADSLAGDFARPDPVLVEHWTHGPERPRATVVALHGFSMGYPRIDAFALFAAQLFRAGLDVALVTLPFHGARTPPDARFSGERFAMPHVARLNEAMRQAIYEVHVLLGWLRDHVDAPVGLLGLSLGGYLSALMAGLRADLDFIIPMVPPVCIGDLAWRFFRQSRHYRSAPAPAFTHEELRAAYRAHSPLTYPLRVSKERILILAGRGDQIVPPDHPHTLWRHWGEPAIVWFSGSHLAPFRRSRLCASVIEHIERCTAGE